MVGLPYRKLNSTRAEKQSFRAMSFASRLRLSSFEIGHVNAGHIEYLPKAVIILDASLKMIPRPICFAEIEYDQPEVTDR